MKKKVLCIAILLIFGTLVSSAQDASFGIRVGANYSSISSDDIPEDLEDSRLGIVVGFLAEYPITEKLSIQPEFQFSSLGNEDEALRVNYLQLPVFIKYNISEMFNVHIGPQAGIKVWEWEDNNGIEANFETFNFAAVVGFGANLTENFFVDLRYGFGVSNIIEDDITDAEGNTRNIQLSVGYKL